MHAVVVTVTRNDPEAAQSELRNKLVPWASNTPGFVSGYWTIKDNSGLTMIIFESEEAADHMSEQVKSTVPDAMTLENVEVRETSQRTPHAPERRTDSRFEAAAGAARWKVCIVGASGKLGQYMVQQTLDRGYDVVGVCREQSVGKLAAFKERITILPGATDDREVIERAVTGCDGVLVVLVPRGVHHYASGTTQAVLDYAPPGARLVFSCGWHITRDGKDVYSRKLKTIVNIAGPIARLVRFADLDDQVEACRRVFASDTRWTVVRGSDLEEGESQGLPSGAGTSATRSSEATRRAVSTSRCSWWRRSKTTNSCTRRRQSSASKRPQRRTLPKEMATKIAVRRRFRGR